MMEKDGKRRKKKEKERKRKMIIQIHKIRPLDFEFMIACAVQGGKIMRNFLVNTGAIFNAL